MRMTIPDRLFAQVLGEIDGLERRGREQYGKDAMRVITPEEEVVLRLRHHDHHGLSAKDTEQVCGLSPSVQANRLARIRGVAPQMFPILRPRTARAYRLFTESNLTCREIAEELGVTPRAVQAVLRRLYDRRAVSGLWFRSNAGRRLSYEPWMDKYTRMKF